ncbi:MAG: ribokinase [Clostridia bacterium]|nr:ribokinase [Clostridia bacterium]MBQ3477374.1 ribokinase [Clostridia bacterium]
MKILNFGSLNVDYVYSVDYFVRAGETLKANSREVLPGGKGLNQSVALARAGAQVYHAGCIGADGEFLRELLNKKGVNTEYLRTIDGMQGHTIIQVDKKGENCILLYGGTNRSIGDSQIDETLAHFGQGDWLVLQNEVNSLPRIVDAAFARGMRIVLNPSPFEESLKEVDFGKLSWLLVNEVEACQCSGSDEPERAWDVLHARYPRLSVLITLGSAGSIAHAVGPDGVDTVRQQAFRADAVDTTAAGDTFTGFFIGGLAEGRPLDECMRRASMASAISVTRMGAAVSIPKVEEVESRLAEL